MEKNFDLSNLEAMCGGDPQFMTDFIKLFVDTIPKTIEQIESAQSEGNWAEIGGSLHKIKPTVELFQMGEITDVLKETEKIARDNGHPDTIKQNLTIILPALTKAAEDLVPELEKYQS